MKIALYIEDGLEQIVLTPETKHETSLLDLIHNGARELVLKQGEFYYCQGGWYRHGEPSSVTRSTFIILQPKPNPPFNPNETEIA